MQYLLTRLASWPYFSRSFEIHRNMRNLSWPNEVPLWSATMIRLWKFEAISSCLMNLIYLMIIAFNILEHSALQRTNQGLVKIISDTMTENYSTHLRVEFTVKKSRMFNMKLNSVLPVFATNKQVINCPHDYFN